MSIEENDIEWVKDGEDASAEVLNRPGKELLSEINDVLAKKVGLTGNETIKGIKTFESFPRTPSAAPTADYQAANKKYVDDGLTTHANSDEVHGATSAATGGKIIRRDSNGRARVTNPVNVNDIVNIDYINKREATNTAFGGVKAKLVGDVLYMSNTSNAAQQ